MPRKSYLTAAEATAILGISRATLYAYVSRGLVRSEQGDVRRRTRRYHAEDIQRLRERQEQRRDPTKAAGDALNWGVPVMNSAITRIVNGSFSYRGLDAVALARSRTVESVASLIWTGNPDLWDDLAGKSPLVLSDRFWAVRAQLAALGPYDLCQALLPIAAVDDPERFGTKPRTAAKAGRRIVLTLIACLTGQLPGLTGIAVTLSRCWAPGNRRAAALIGAALVLSADHELNASSFTARCVASTGAGPYAVVQGGLAALRGHRHGGMSELVEEILLDDDRPAGYHLLFRERLKRGEIIPGFGHALYPDGDPRGRALLEMAANALPDAPVIAQADRIVDAAWSVLSEHPNLDFSLAVLSRALDLPRGSALCLFALGRTIGWIGHAIEQYESGKLIRPRARYVGVI